MLFWNYIQLVNLYIITGLLWYYTYATSIYLLCLSSPFLAMTSLYTVLVQKTSDLIRLCVIYLVKTMSMESVKCSYFKFEVDYLVNLSVPLGSKDFHDKQLQFTVTHN